MKCPHCGYEHGSIWNPETMTSNKVNGEEGDFYELPIKLRKETFGDVYEKVVIGCPKCKIVFMGGSW